MPHYEYRKEQALSRLKDYLEEIGEPKDFFNHIKDIAEKAIDFYLCDNRRCTGKRCHALVSNYSKHGMCRKCYNKWYMRNRRETEPGFKEAEVLKTRERRKKRKLEENWQMCIECGEPVDPATNSVLNCHTWCRMEL